MFFLHPFQWLHTVYHIPVKNVCQLPLGRLPLAQYTTVARYSVDECMGTALWPYRELLHRISFFVGPQRKQGLCPGLWEITRNQLSCLPRSEFFPRQRVLLLRCFWVETRCFGSHRKGRLIYWPPRRLATIAKQPLIVPSPPGSSLYPQALAICSYCVSLWNANFPLAEANLTPRSSPRDLPIGPPMTSSGRPLPALPPHTQCQRRAEAAAICGAVRSWVCCTHRTADPQPGLSPHWTLFWKDWLAGWAWSASAEGKRGRKAEGFRPDSTWPRSSRRSEVAAAGARLVLPSGHVCLLSRAWKPEAGEDEGSWHASWPCFMKGKVIFSAFI